MSVPTEVVPPDAGTPAETTPPNAGTPAETTPPDAGTPADDPYRDPTLEDLQGNPMPLTQKIVIAVALVCIIGAVIYYFAFMG